MFEAKVIEDSVSPWGKRLTTLQLRYPRFVHAELMTHRVFSRNASSSRAIPVAKMLEQVRNEPAVPIHWGKNQPGMQAREQLEGRALTDAGALWLMAAREAATIAEQMNEVGLHKQIANRILEPFQFISVVVTATEWDNFFQLRDHPDAQPEIAHLARLMRRAMDESLALKLGYSAQPFSHVSYWHLPYITGQERLEYQFEPKYLACISAARCARVSYLKHDQTEPSADDDMQLYKRLVGSEPLHASPVEHQAHTLPYHNGKLLTSRNFVGWKQHREYVEAGFQSAADSHR